MDGRCVLPEAFTGLHSYNQTRRDETEIDLRTYGVIWSSIRPCDSSSGHVFRRSVYQIHQNRCDRLCCQLELDSTSGIQHNFQIATTMPSYISLHCSSSPTSISQQHKTLKYSRYANQTHTNNKSMQYCKPLSRSPCLAPPITLPCTPWIIDKKLHARRLPKRP